MRLFIAIDIDDKAKGHLERAIERGRVSSPDSKWVRADQLHATLVFLGSIEAPRVEEITLVMTKVTRQHRALRLSLGAGDAFGSKVHPRVLFAKLEGDVERLSAVQRDLADALEGLAPAVFSAGGPGALPGRDRAYSPHVTLARSKHRDGDEGLALALPAIKAAPKDPFAVTELVLYRSDTRPTGATYVRTFAAPLLEPHD